MSSFYKTQLQYHIPPLNNKIKEIVYFIKNKSQFLSFINRKFVLKI